jgi:hypothetical protein
MGNLSRLLLWVSLVLTLLCSAGCGSVAVGVGDGYYYGSRRLPLDYFYAPYYYDGLWYRDYVVYDGYWYYEGSGTPYYYDDPYWW